MKFVCVIFTLETLVCWGHKTKRMLVPNVLVNVNPSKKSVCESQIHKIGTFLLLARVVIFTQKYTTNISVNHIWE